MDGNKSYKHELPYFHAGYDADFDQDAHLVSPAAQGRSATFRANESYDATSYENRYDPAQSWASLDTPTAAALADLDTPVHESSSSPGFEPTTSVVTVEPRRGFESAPLEAAVPTSTTTRATTAPAKSWEPSRNRNHLEHRNAMIFQFLAVAINLGAILFAVFYPNTAQAMIDEAWFISVFTILPILFAVVLFVFYQKTYTAVSLVALFVFSLSYSPMLFGLAAFGPQYWLTIFTGLTAVPLIAAIIYQCPYTTNPIIIFGISAVIALIFNFIMPVWAGVSWAAAGYSVLAIVGSSIFLCVEICVNRDPTDFEDTVKLAVTPYIHVFYGIVGLIALAIFVAFVVFTG